MHCSSWHFNGNPFQGHFVSFWGCIWAVLGSGQGHNNVFGSPHMGYLLSFFKYSSNQHFSTDHFQGHFGSFELYWATFGVAVGSENCFRVSLFRLKTLIFSSFLYLVFLMLTQFRVILGLLGLYLFYFGVRVRSENCFGVSSYRP